MGKKKSILNDELGILSEVRKEINLYREFHFLYEELRHDEQKFSQYSKLSIHMFDYILENI